MHFLLDSNIVIYLLNKEKHVISFLKKFKDATFSISMITWIEVLSGSYRHKKNIPELSADLDRFYKIPVHSPIGLKAAELIQAGSVNGRRTRFQDSVIAATSMIHKMNLITNNPKDFRNFKGLKITPIE